MLAVSLPNPEITNWIDQLLDERKKAPSGFQVFRTGFFDGQEKPSIGNKGTVYPRSKTIIKYHPVHEYKGCVS